MIIRKAPRRIQEVQEDECRLGRRSLSGFPPLAPKMQVGQDSWKGPRLVTLRAVGVWIWFEGLEGAAQAFH